MHKRSASSSRHQRNPNFVLKARGKSCLKNELSALPLLLDEEKTAGWGQASMFMAPEAGNKTQIISYTSNQTEQNCDTVSTQNYRSTCKHFLYNHRHGALHSDGKLVTIFKSK